MEGDMILQTIAQFGAPTLLCFVIFLKGTEKLDAVAVQLANLDKNVVRRQLPATKVASLGSETPNCLDTADLLTAETISRGLLITKAI